MPATGAPSRVTCPETSPSSGISPLPQPARVKAAMAKSEQERREGRIAGVLREVKRGWLGSQPRVARSVSQVARSVSPVARSVSQVVRGVRRWGLWVWGRDGTALRHDVLMGGGGGTGRLAPCRFQGVRIRR